MARLLGCIANRPDLCSLFAEHERETLAAQRQSEELWGWGIGFYQSGEILLKRRPLDDAVALNPVEMMGEVRSDLLISHIRRATVGAQKTSNTHPFRYRQWLFADTGTVNGFGDVRAKMHETLPQFLQRSLRGNTDSELLFHLFLSFLHDAGKLDHEMVAPEDAISALKSSLGLLDRISSNAGLEATQLNILLGTPEYLIASRRGAPMAYKMLAGREALAPLFADEGPLQLRMPDLDPCRLAVVASDFDDGEVPNEWVEVEDGAIVTFTRTDEPLVVQR